MTSRSSATVSTATLDSVTVMTNGADVCPTTLDLSGCRQPLPGGLSGLRRECCEQRLVDRLWRRHGYLRHERPVPLRLAGAARAMARSAPMSGGRRPPTPYSKAGVMVRAGTGSAANAPFYDIVACPNGIVYVQYRDSAGASGGRRWPTISVCGPGLAQDRAGGDHLHRLHLPGWRDLDGGDRLGAHHEQPEWLGADRAGGHLTRRGHAAHAPSSTRPAPPSRRRVPSPSRRWPRQRGSAAIPSPTAYNDASQPTSLTYSDNEVASYGYDSSAPAGSRA